MHSLLVDSAHHPSLAERSKVFHEKGKIYILACRKKKKMLSGSDSDGRELNRQEFQTNETYL